MDQMAEVIDVVMEGRCREEEISLLLTALHTKGETVAEIAGAASAMRKHMTPIRSHHTELLDTCGTGGDRSGTFNISTAAAIVTAAAGVPVAKHGNRKITSKSGSADVLAELGVNVDAPVEVVERCLDELGLCFCFAPQLHPAMKHVAAVRRQLGFPTIFNLLGPLSNPASAPFQVLGVGKPELRDLLAEALRLLGTRRSIVVHGDDGLDEVTIGGTTRVTHIRSGATEQLQWQPGDFGLPPGDLAELQAEGPAESAALIRQVLDGSAGATRNIVLQNAAAALWTAGREDSLTACCERAASAIDEGRAAQLLRDLAQLGHR